MSDQEKSKKPANSQDDAKELLYSLLTSSEDALLLQGLENLSKLPETNEGEHIISGKPFVQGFMGFRRVNKNLSIAIAGGKALVRYIELKKFIALVEQMHNPETATILLRNFQDQDEYRSGRGQELARINAKCSAIQVMQGLCGRVIKSPSDLAAHDVYYISRKTLTSLYLAAKEQMAHENEMESLIAAYDGWKQFNVPLDPMNPYKE